MLNMKKTFLATALLTMMATAAFAAPADAPQSVTMKERTNAILHADAYQKDKAFADKAMGKLSATERAQVNKYLDTAMEQKAERRELHKQVKAMTKDQQIAFRASIHLTGNYDKHGKHIARPHAKPGKHHIHKHHGQRFEHKKWHHNDHKDWHCGDHKHWKPMPKPHHGRPAPHMAHK